MQPPEEYVHPLRAGADERGEDGAHGDGVHVDLAGADRLGHRGAHERAEQVKESSERDGLAEPFVFAPTVGDPGEEFFGIRTGELREQAGEFDGAGLRGGGAAFQQVIEPGVFAGKFVEGRHGVRAARVAEGEM